MGLNYSLTGVFYNKALAAKIGMTSPPTTLAELDALLAKAKAAGITPIVQFNGGATGGLLFPLQQLMAVYGPPARSTTGSSTSRAPTSTPPSNLAGRRRTSQQWIKAGYFNSDANATDYPTMMSKFMHGDGLLIFDGDWESGNFDKHMAGKVGFFLMPPLKAGGEARGDVRSADATASRRKRSTPTAPPSSSTGWRRTRRRARSTSPSAARIPAGPPSLPIPTAEAGLGDRADARRRQGRRAGQRRDGLHRERDGAIYAQSWTPAVQKLFGGQETPDDVLKKVQSDYEKQVKSGG